MNDMHNTISFRHIQTSQRDKSKSCYVAVNFPPTHLLLQPSRSDEVKARFDLVALSKQGKYILARREDEYLEY